MEEFIYNLNTKNVVTTPFLSENKINGISNFIKALVFIIPGIYFLYKYYYKSERKEFTSFEEVNSYVNETEKTSAISQVIQGIIFIILAIRLFYFYHPSNSQISLGLLIKYLQRKKVISEDFYQVIKKLKPEGMSKFGHL